MIYFIPAWYMRNRWRENEQNWYVRRQRTEFDETVKQIQLFHRKTKFPYMIMLLSYAPNFRHFMHRQSMVHAPYWSCFDAIGEIRRKRGAVLSFHNLKWPDNIEFIYTRFVIVAMLEGKLYAKIEFGEDGNPIQIDMFENDVICRRNLYDDRGFVSGSIVYKNGKPEYEDYLTENGIIKMRQYTSDGHVEINSQRPKYLLVYNGEESERTFSKLRYDTIEDVIYEVLEAYLALTDANDVFCMAMHERHATLLGKALQGRKTILTFFEDRYNIDEAPQAREIINDADYIITDSRENTGRVIASAGKILKNITDITPYDSRVDFGISQQLTVQKILVPVDSIDDVIFGEIIRSLAEYIDTNSRAEVHLFTRSADYNRDEFFLSKTRTFLKQFGYPEQWAVKEKAVMSENDISDETEQIPIRFIVEQCVDELSVSKCLREQRIIIDLRNTTALYLRIAAISVGIPQIVRKESEFVRNGKNGIVLRTITELPKMLSYYLDSMNNWNEAMVHSYEMGKKYTTAVLVSKWREVIDYIERD